MLKGISKENRALILLEFTKNLLMHSGYAELAELKKIIKENEKEHGKKTKFSDAGIKELIKGKEEKEIHKEKITLGIAREIKIKPKVQPLIHPRVLRIPEPRLPENLQYLKPTMHHVEIDLGKLNPFISDPVVRRIECNGPGQNIVVMVPMPKYTNIILNKEEIDEIIKIFEKKSKIPASEGIYNIILGKLVFSAIISDVIGSKFSIKKINYAPIY